MMKKMPLARIDSAHERDRQRKQSFGDSVHGENPDGIAADAEERRVPEAHHPAIAEYEVEADGGEAHHQRARDHAHMEGIAEEWKQYQRGEHDERNHL
jgi:hypothetical protein